MAKTETITCDVCGVVKGNVNHWYMVSFGNSVFGWYIGAWEEKNETDSNIKHVCGQAHAHKLLDEFFQRTHRGNESTEFSAPSD